MRAITLTIDCEHQRRAATLAASAGWLRLLPARGARWTRRYVVTATGSHMLGTFDHVDLVTTYRRSA